MGKVEYTVIVLTIFLMFALWADVVVPKTFGISEKMKKDLVCVNMKGAGNALKRFKLDNGMYPKTEEGFEALQHNLDLDKYMNYDSLAYLEKLPKDSWGAKILYVKTKDGFELISYGADRKKGGENEYADIYYSECDR